MEITDKHVAVGFLIGCIIIASALAVVITHELEFRRCTTEQNNITINIPPQGTPDPWNYSKTYSIGTEQYIKNMLKTQHIVENLTKRKM